MTDFETRLQQALRPVDPPEDLSERLESTLQTLTELAADELDAWELGAMRDPRNWVRPVAAAAVGGVATAALVLVRVRAAHHRREARDPLALAGRAVDELRRALDH